MNDTSALRKDLLTGLYNRWQCRMELQTILDNGGNRVFCTIDLDNFKSINELYGSVVGDNLLKAIAAALHSVYPDAFLCRISGDEFGFILAPTTYSRYEMSVVTRRLFNTLHEIHAEGLDKNHRLTFSIGSVYIDTNIHQTADDIYREASSSRHIAKQHQGNFLCSKYGFIPDVEGCFMALREDRALYNEINNSLFSIHNETDWLDYLRHGAAQKEDMFRRNQGHLDDLLAYYKATDLPSYDYELLFHMVFKFFNTLDAFMYGMLIDGILIPYYEHQDLNDPYIRGHLGRLYLLLADSLVSVVRMGDESQRQRIVDLVKKCCDLTRTLPRDSHEFEPYVYAICEMVGHYESLDLHFGDISDCDKYYEELRDLLLGPNAITLTDKYSYRHFEYLVQNARLFPLYRACYLLVKAKLSPAEQEELSRRLTYIREHLVDGVYDMAGKDPEYKRMATYLQDMLLGDLSTDEIFIRLQKGLHTIHMSEYGMLSEANLVIVAYLFLAASKILLETSFSVEQKHALSMAGLDFLFELLRKRENIANDQQLLFLTQILLRSMMQSPILSAIEKLNFLEKSMGIVMIDTYSHSKAVGGYAKVILCNIIDHYPELLVGPNRIYNTIEDVNANREELLDFMEVACSLHDIGKMCLTPITSNAYRRLTDQEFMLIRQHPAAGVGILQPEHAFDLYRPFVYSHHRWWNEEAGYPAVSQSEERSGFKVLVDILSICDSLEAATSRIGRNYRSAKTFLQILDELIVESGTRYNKEIVQTIIGSPDTYYTLRQMIDHNWQSIYQSIYQEVVVQKSFNDFMVCSRTRMPDIYAHTSMTAEEQSLRDFYHKLRIPEWVVQMKREDLLLYTFSLMERNRISVKHNQVIIFFYNVKEDTMGFIHCDEHGQPRHSHGTHYSDHRIGTVFSEEGYQKAMGTFIKMLNDPNSPREGQMTLEYADKTKCLIATYTCITDTDNQIKSIVGYMEDINRSRDKMLRSIKSQNDRLEMFESLSDCFETIVYTDVKCEHFELIKGFPMLVEAVSTMTSTRELIDYTRKNLVDEEFHKAFDLLTDEKTIVERLRGQRYLTFEYHSDVTGWLNARILPAAFDDQGNVTHVIFATESSEVNHEQMDYLARAAHFDGLTGLLNRMAGETIVREKIANDGPQIFALLDCDHFKQINDQLSHLAGDQVLRGQSKVLREYFKDYTVLRMGGDEFVVYIDGPDADRLINTYNGIYNLFLGLKDRLTSVKLAELEYIAPTMSAGVVFTEGSMKDNSFEKMYLKADEALHESKKIRNGFITIEDMKYVQFYH